MNVVAGKGPDAFRTISEASAELGVPSHVLRFWETKFSFIRPMKRAGGRRFYRPRDLDVLKGVRALLHEEGYTIKGVQRLHKEEGVRRLLVAAGATSSADAEATLLALEADADTPSGDEEALGVDALDFAPRPRVVVAQARERLMLVLDDLQTAKAAVDRLLSAPAES